MSRKNIRILVVDDEEIVRESLSGWLRKDGYTVAVAADGPTAIEMLKEEEAWSVILLDLKMTPMDGLQVLEEAQKIRPGERVVEDRIFARRVYFDLIGLPPPPAELARFLADAGAGKRERLVERLLAPGRRPAGVDQLDLFSGVPDASPVTGEL